MKIIPAVLSDDLADAQVKIELVDTIADWIQIDVMDGKFVDNVSVTLEEIGTLDVNSHLEAHLMVDRPMQFIDPCVVSGFERIVFHVESKDDPSDVLHEMYAHGVERGIALSPETPLSAIEPYVPWVDVVLFLGVSPGFGGQEFKPAVVEKIREFKKDHSNVTISVDGGVNMETIPEIKDAGADIFVVGSGLFGAEDVHSRFESLQAL